MLNRSRPDLVRDIHRSYLEAGCDVIDTGGTTIAEVMRTVYII